MLFAQLLSAHLPLHKYCFDVHFFLFLNISGLFVSIFVKPVFLDAGTFFLKFLIRLLKSF